MKALRAALIGLTVFTMSCRTEEPTAPSIQSARGGSGNLTVTSVVPDSSERGVTLDITVNGSGFDNGSAVTLERQGVPASGITTNATSFVSPRKLIANITVAAEADTGKYDVAVMTTGGRKGVGIELFTVTYVIDELGIIGGTWSRAHAINEAGEVVGASCTDECLSTAFYWSEADGQVDLGGLPGYSRSAAYAINNRGQVYGRVWCPTADPQCGGAYKSSMVRWERVGNSWTIAIMEGCRVVLPVSEGSEKILINDSDECVGSSADFGPVLQTLSGTTVVSEDPLPAPFVGGWYQAYAINDAAMIAGAGSAPNESSVPVIWYRDLTGDWAVLRPALPGNDTRGEITDIGEPDGAGRVRATGYAESGTFQGDVVRRGVRWTLEADGAGDWRVASTEVLETTRQNGLRANVFARAVNRQGDVVGSYGSHFDSGDPVKWPVTGGFEVLPAPNGGASGRAVDINDQGWIVGAVWDNSNKCDRAAIWRLK